MSPDWLLRLKDGFYILLAPLLVSFAVSNGNNLKSSPWNFPFAFSVVLDLAYLGGFDQIGLS